MELRSQGDPAAAASTTSRECEDSFAEAPNGARRSAQGWRYSCQRFPLELSYVFMVSELIDTLGKMERIISDLRSEGSDLKSKLDAATSATARKTDELDSMRHRVSALEAESREHLLLLERQSSSEVLEQKRKKLLSSNCSSSRQSSFARKQISRRTCGRSKVEQKVACFRML